jgi:hypothetical protein
MAKVHWRSCVLAALFMFGTALVPKAVGSDEYIPPLRDKERMQKVFIALMAPALGPAPYISRIPLNHPFTAIGFAVRGRAGPDAQVLAEFARHAMDVRLRELGVSQQIQMASSVDPNFQDSPPDGVRYCDMLSVTFSFNVAAHDVEGRSVFVIAADMVARQPASEERAPGEWHCLDGPASDGMVQVGPRVAVLPGEGESIAMQQSKALILGFIDSEIVPMIVRMNKTAAETFKSWTRDSQ